ncbi:hypothetical protein AYO40_06345 [Planctomycetaceae bacterium SCGC AG-212-D15]|nr:hypothetical protein AYO40_06345 [Planctomycetaceae bacterium SCGC AG-212-D15]
MPFAFDRSQEVRTVQTNQKIAGANMSPEVAEYAASRGWTDHITAMVDAVHSLFPDGGVVSVYLEDDSEIGDLRFVVFEVRPHGLTVEEMVEAQRRWSEEMRQRLPPPYHYHLVLGLEPAS